MRSSSWSITCVTSASPSLWRSSPRPGASAMVVDGSAAASSRAEGDSGAGASASALKGAARGSGMLGTADPRTSATAGLAEALASSSIAVVGSAAAAGGESSGNAERGKVSLVGAAAAAARAAEVPSASEVVGGVRGSASTAGVSGDSHAVSSSGSGTTTCCERSQSVRYTRLKSFRRSGSLLRMRARPSKSLWSSPPALRRAVAVPLSLARFLRHLLAEANTSHRPR
mmetsp:Transcript_3488/g.12507  ORF Transcript_3488/g.12507 Transcript_3488/m.12507 type:complete len:228 (+) Transcript_3488:1995-2678(+)